VSRKCVSITKTDEIPTMKQSSEPAEYCAMKTDHHIGVSPSGQPNEN
jgi:hypothetical protein